MPYARPKNSSFPPNIQDAVVLIASVVRRMAKFKSPDSKTETERRNEECDRRRKGKAAPQTPHRG